MLRMLLFLLALLLMRTAAWGVQRRDDDGMKSVQPENKQEERSGVAMEKCARRPREAVNIFFCDYYKTSSTLRDPRLRSFFHLRLHGVFAHREVGGLFGSTRRHAKAVLVRLASSLSNSLNVLFILGQAAADGARLFRAEILGEVLVALGQFTKLRLLRLVVHSKHLGDRLANDTNPGKLGSSASSHLSNAKLRKLKLEVIQLLLQLLLRLVAKLVHLMRAIVK